MGFKPTYSIGDLRCALLGIKAEGASLLPLVEVGGALQDSLIGKALAVVVVCSGTAKVDMEGKRSVLRSNNMLVISDLSNLASLRCSKACVGYVIAFSSEFLGSMNIEVRDVVKGQAMLCQGPCITLSAQDMGQFGSVVMSLCEIGHNAKEDYAERAVASLFAALFYLFVSVMRRVAEGVEDSVQKRTRSEELFSAFMALLGEECERERSVEYYASCLGITPKYLSMVCHRQTSKSASKVIDEAVVRRAKSLLMQSGQSVRDVAERLNFISPAFFGKYFKQRVGVAPSRYRLQKI